VTLNKNVSRLYLKVELASHIKYAYPIKKPAVE